MRRRDRQNELVVALVVAIAMAFALAVSILLSLGDETDDGGNTPVSVVASQAPSEEVTTTPTEEITEEVTIEDSPTEVITETVEAEPTTTIDPIEIALDEAVTREFTRTPRPSRTPTESPIPTETDTFTPTATATDTSSPTPTDTPSNTPTPTPTDTKTSTPTSTPTETLMPFGRPRTLVPTTEAPNVPSTATIEGGAQVETLDFPLDGSSEMPTITPESQVVVESLPPTPDEIEVVINATQPTPSCIPRNDWDIYVIDVGDTFFSIAQASNISMDALQAGNCITNPALIYAGQPIRVPRGSALPVTETIDAAVEDCNVPNAIITSPKPGDALDGFVNLIGIASGDTFRRYILDWRLDDPAIDYRSFEEIFRAVPQEGQLSRFNTDAFQPGLYWFRLRVLDTNDYIIGECSIRVRFE